MIENKEMKKMMCDFDKVYVSGRQVGVDIIPRKIDNYTAETEGKIHNRSHFSAFAVSEPVKTVRTLFSRKNKSC